MFAEDVAGRLREYLPVGYQDLEYQVVERQKNNGACQIGIQFRSAKEQTGFVIYMEAFYQEAVKGKALNEIMNELTTQIKNAAAMKMQISRLNFSDFDSVRKKVSLLLVNTKANRQMLEAVPSTGIEDLSAVCRIEFPMPGIQSDIKITYAHLEQWGIGKKELFEAAFENLERSEDFVMQDITDVIERRNAEGKEAGNFLNRPEGFSRETELPLYLLSNKRHIEGASVMLNHTVMEKVSRLFPEGFYILPFSIHEVFIVPKDEYLGSESFGYLMQEINRECVGKSDFLSDSIYEYDKKHGKIRRVLEPVEKRKEMER